MPAIATGQISILDFNDAPSLTAFVSTTAQKTQTFDPPTGVYAPSWTAATGPILQPSLFVSTTGSTDQIANAKSVTWFDSSNMTTPLTSAGNYVITGSTLKVVANIMTGSVYSKTFVAQIVWENPETLAEHLIRAEFTFSRINNGATGGPGENAISAVLSNDADTVPSDSAGGSQVVTGVASTVTVYEGATDVTALWSMGTPVVSGATGVFSGTPTNRTWTLNASGMTADIATVTWTLTRSGYATITKKFTISRLKAGVNAPIPTLYRLIPSVNAIQRNIAGVYTPTTITANARAQTGTAAPADYAGRFVIEETTDGTTYAVKYTSAANEASKVWTPTAGIKALKIKLFIAGATTGIPLDEQIIPIVSDGATGADAVFVSTTHAQGNLFKNDNVSTLTVTADLYKGGVIQTSGVTYEWFGQKATIVTDQGAGLGWEKLTTANQASYGVTGSVTGATMTVTADGVVNIAVFKVKATFASRAYMDSAIFYDSSDPVMVDIVSSKGNLFKNGSVSTELVCKLFQNGAEIDPRVASATVGYKYTYTWSKYNLSGNLDPTFGGTGTKVGKFITISDADVDQKATFKVDISTV